jgi:undecaprenyl-diphosphatase
LAWGVILGTLPAVLLVLLFGDFIEGLFATPTAVAAFLLVTAAILTVSERLGRRARNLESLTIADALVIGAAQGVAIAPGISRSGATIAAGLGLGLSRTGAARFSFLLSMPAILGAGVSQLLAVARGISADTPWTVVGAGFLAAAVSGYLCIRFLLAYLQRGRLYVFAAYCAVVGVAALVLSLVR